MSEPSFYPFPTVERLARECGERWDAFGRAFEATREGENALKLALESVGGGSRFGSDAALVLFGSVRSREWK